MKVLAVLVKLCLQGKGGNLYFLKCSLCERNDDYM